MTSSTASSAEPRHPTTATATAITAPDVSAIFAQGLALHRQGQLAPAKAAYLAVLQIQPAHFDAQHLLGVVAGQSGDFADAVGHIRKALALNPNHISAHINLALALENLSRMEEALACYDRVIALQPDHAQAWYKRGMLLQALQRHAAAVDSYRQVLAIDPGNADAWFNQGNALKQLRHLADALHSFDQAIACKPDHANAYSNRGNTLRELHRLEEALASFDQAIAINPDAADAWCNRGTALFDLKRFEAALASFDQAIARRAQFPDAHSNRGLVLKELQRPDEALASYDQALALQPDYAQAHSNRGALFMHLKRYAEALLCFDRALASKPDYMDAWSNRGLALHELGRTGEAVRSYDQAISLKPDYADAYYNRGNAFMAQNDLRQALASYDRAIALQPGYAQACFNKSLALLLGGQLVPGWEMYEWRWKNEKSGTRPPRFTQPRWLGSESLVGKTILLYGEQGLGDSIQFCRYVPLVKQLGARVLLSVPQALLRLLEGMAGIDELLETGTPLPPFDCHCPLLSLPLAFKTGLDQIPALVPFLPGSQEQRTVWRQRLGRKQAVRVGLVWRGSTVNTNDHKRSFPLAQWLPHLPPGLDYVSLQKEMRPEDLPALAGSSIRHFGEQIHDFTDTAALCALMDVVVTVDTSVAHLAATLGKPTWILLTCAPDWRWLLEREDSPWYPSARLYRQAVPGAWGALLERLALDLREFN